MLEHPLYPAVPAQPSASREWEELGSDNPSGADNQQERPASVERPSQLLRKSVSLMIIRDPAIWNPQRPYAACLIGSEMKIWS